ncbi:CHAT domain-containing protein [Streptomyces chattanoogensis]|uniref:CHAT domain-containing protein n=1 Tax=Streptomyces chattanoogensis TaxID=66876 RepID=UPI003CCBCB2B
MCGSGAWRHSRTERWSTCPAHTQSTAPARPRIGFAHLHRSFGMKSSGRRTGLLFGVPNGELERGEHRRGGAHRTAFPLAGYRHVVGTLWRLADNAAARIADNFSFGLAPSFHADDTARMPHRAVCGLRGDAPDKPSGWAAPIHPGR